LSDFLVRDFAGRRGADKIASGNGNRPDSNSLGEEEIMGVRICALCQDIVEAIDEFGFHYDGLCEECREAVLILAGSRLSVKKSLDKVGRIYV